MRTLLGKENTWAFVGNVCRLATVALLSGLASCHGFARSPSTRIDAHRSLVLTVHDTQEEDTYDPATDSLIPHRYESIITYSGRIEDSGELRAKTYNDSIRFRGFAPHRLEAFMSRDTLQTVSMERQGAVQGESTEIDKPMLECLFVGPSLSITIDENGGWKHIDHMKKDCPGGIYKRLDLPRTLSFFVMRIPSGQRQTGDQWEHGESCPSYAGFGTLPELRIAYRISHMDENELTVQLACDTTLKNISVVMPNGEKASIISNRVHVEGTIGVGADGGLCREGKAFISEKMRYVRGEISTAVLHKECRYSLTLASLP